MIACGYGGQLLELAEWLKLEPRHVWLLRIEHDPWCAEVGGCGHPACVPEFSMKHLG